MYQVVIVKKNQCNLCKAETEFEMIYYLDQIHNWNG
jgi:hypothetical protein